VIRMRPPTARTPDVALSVLRWAWESGVTVLGSVEEDHERAAQILQQCADRRLSYFDGLLMAVAERRQIAELVTVDGAHFHGVRLAHTPQITVV
jgi:predicted nucleic acid-binding protein